MKLENRSVILTRRRRAHNIFEISITNVNENNDIVTDYIINSRKKEAKEITIDNLQIKYIC